MKFDLNQNRPVVALLGTGFITGVDLLLDGGVIAAMNSGKFSLGE